MNPRFTRVLIILILTVLLYKAFRHFSFQRSPPIENIVVINENGDTVEKVKVSVYYEALCPDSKFFIETQLLPTYDKLKHQLMVDLVPYGKAQTIMDNNGEPDFECQHGPIECFANKVHSCVIKLVTEENARVQYIACMINDNQDPEHIGRFCGTKFNLNFDPILTCAKGSEGSNLLKHYGERTHGLNPLVTFIPTVELNESQSVASQAIILKELFRTVCDLYKTAPEICNELE